MPASIVLSRLCWSTPDGQPLFSDLDLSFGAERAGLVGRNGVGKTTLLKLISGELRPQSGRVSINCAPAVLRQIVLPDPNETIADLFGCADALAILRRAETGKATNEELATADWMLEARIASALARVGLPAPPAERLAALSGGQRTRAGLAAVIFSEPDFILLDEPTNNLDRDGREAVIDFLKGWRGGAIVVSHDRDLLEEMDAIVELTSLGASRYGGAWSRYRARKAQELDAARRDLADAEKHLSELAERAQAVAEKQARKDSAGRAKRARDDMPRIARGMLKDKSEGTGGAHARIAESRRAQAVEAAATARQRIEILQPLTVTLPPTRLPANKDVIRVEQATAGYDLDRPIIRDLTFSMTGPERAALTGANGSGKTTLLALITGRLQPWTGTARILCDFVILDQQVGLLDRSLSIRDNFRRIHPAADENACRAALARFMFRADAALQAASTLSGGQLLRAGLACALGGPTPPPLLILDEPTNHLDVDSIAAVEAGLRAYDGALLVVSHDEAFLREIGVTRRLELPAPVAGAGSGPWGATRSG